MKFDKKVRVLAVAIAAASGSPFVMASQADSKGFIEDSSLNFLTRNLYWNQDRRGSQDPAVTAANSHHDRREWGQGFRLDYASGYTQGTVGFGVDASAYALVKLDGGAGYSGAAGVLVPEHDSTNSSAASAGANVKVRVSNTELKYGNNLRPYNPVFAPADARLVPGTATGFWLSSSELEGLTAEAGHMTASKDFNSTNSNGNFYASYAGVASDTVDFLGATYALNDQLSFGLYGAEYEDVWRQYYANANYTFPISDEQSLNFDFNIYRTNDEGRELAGDIDTTAYSLAGAWTVGAHTFKVTYQKVNGDTPFDYLGLGPGTYHDSIYLANSSQISDFNGPNERSWGVFYTLDMASYGVPGLSFGARYIRGTDVDASNITTAYNYYQDSSSEEHWERDFDIKYALQSGPAKGLSFRLRQATHRSGQGASTGSMDEVRFIVNYPYEIF